MLGFNLIEEEKNSELGFTEELQNFIDEENRNLAVVSTIDEANYTIRRIKELQEQKEHDIAEAERMLKLYKDKVKMFIDSKCSSYDFEIERLQQMLEPYIQSSLEETGKKSVKFIEGTAGYRKQEKLIDHDDIELEKEVKGIDDDKYFKTVTKFSWPNLKKDLEFVDGKVLLNGKELTNVRYEDRDDAFYVK